jgi:cation:H+ antiporter
LISTRFILPHLALAAAELSVTGMPFNLFDLFVFSVSLLVLVKSSEMCINYSSKLARALKWSEFIVSFFIVSIISVLPEGAVSIASAFEGQPSFGVATVIGSVIADLALVFGLVALFSRDGLKVRSDIIRKDFLYLVLILLPLVLGADGLFSRADGVVLVLGGLLFYFTLSIESGLFKKKYDSWKSRSMIKYILMFLFSLALLLVSAYLLVFFGAKLANDFQISVMLIGVIVAGLGTCTPELFFSINAVRTKHEELALGNLLGTVITDCTFLLGATALICPVAVDTQFLMNAGVFMFIGGLLLLWFIKSDKTLTKREGFFLLLFYLGFIVTEVLLGLYQ